MASLPLPASLNLRDRDAVESRSPKRHRPLEPPRPRPEDSGSHREPSPPPSLRRRTGGTPPSPSPSKVRRQSRSPPHKVRRRSRSPPPPKFRRRSRSPPRSPAPSKSRCRSRSPPPSNVRRRSRSPPPSKPGRRSRSPLPYKVRRRSRSPLPYKARRRSRSPPSSNVRRRSRSPPPSKVRRRSRSPPPSKFRRRSRSPPYVSSTQCLEERPHAKRPSAEAAVEVERARQSSLDESLVGNRPSHSQCNCKHPETSSAAVEKRPDPAITGDEQKLDCEKMDRKNQSDYKAPSRSARRKKMKRQIKAEAKKEIKEHPETSSPAVEKRPDPAIRGYEHQLHSEKMDGKNQSGHKHAETSSAAAEKRPDPAIRGGEQKLDCEKMGRKNQSDGKAPSRSARRKKMKRQAKKETREMKREKLLENIKKLQSCVWLLEKDGADMAEMMEFRSMLESTKKQYVENEAQLATEGSSAPLQVLIMDRLEKTAEEVNHLKSELETVRRDRDDQLAQAQSLMADVAKQKEVARRYGIELEDAMMRIAALEKGCLLRRETINALQIQLASANEKLTVPSPSRDLMPN